jgi:simple sugar transport system ATP-binding protein
VEAKPAAVEMIEVTRRFARVVANDRVNLRVEPGEIHAIVGENGAGKSTLMKILYGLYRPDSGTIRVHGREVHFRSPADAIAAGIGMVHQHFMLIQTFTVAENVVLGDERTRRGLFFPDDAVRRVAELAKGFQIAVDPAARVGDLSVGQQQRVEILKILYRQADIIILDEPTAVLTPQETDALFDTVRSLRAQGKTIIIITHKLREVMALSDRLTILRAGRNVATLVTAETNPEEIARLMVGRSISLPVLALDAHPIAPSATPEESDQDAGAPRTTERAEVALSPSANGKPVLRLEEVSLQRKAAPPLLSDVTFDVRQGEILGIAGVEGNGQRELVEVITGLTRPTHGRIWILDREVTQFPPREKFAAGLACIPEDRQRQGLILDFTLRENLLLGRHHEPHFRRQLRGEGCRRLLEEFDVRPPDPRLRASQLSGGNQQKVIVAREMTRGAPLLVAAQPTRGIDLGAIEFIHRKLLEMRANGVAILLISAELTEILALSDRVAVMFGGRIVFMAENRGLTEHDLGIHMAGGSKNDASATPLGGIA